MQLLKIIIIPFLVMFLTGCESIFDSVYQSIEIDHFEQVIDIEPEFQVGIEEIPNFKVFVDRVSPDGDILSKDRFDILEDSIDTNTVGVYQLTYHFTSLDELVEHQITVHITQRPKEDIIDAFNCNAGTDSLICSITLVESDYQVSLSKIGLYKMDTDIKVEAINQSIDLNNIIFDDLSSNTLYYVSLYFDDGSVYTYNDIQTSPAN